MCVVVFVVVYDVVAIVVVVAVVVGVVVVEPLYVQGKAGPIPPNARQCHDMPMNTSHDSHHMS